MCIILDADICHLLFTVPISDDFKPVLIWLLKKDGKLVYGGENKRQLIRIRKVSTLIKELRKSAKAEEIIDVDFEQMRIEAQYSFNSNDAHIIALARKSGARTLCSRDHDLHTDFKNLQLVPPPKGKIYQNRDHVGVLRHTHGCKKA